MIKSQAIVLRVVANNTSCARARRLAVMSTCTLHYLDKRFATACQEQLRLTLVQDRSMCETCFKTGTKLRMCLGCKQAWYCSPECQKRAWKSHKTACKLVARIKGECYDNTLGDKAVVFPILFNSVLQVRPRCE